MAGGKIDILVHPDVKDFPNKLESGLRGSLGSAAKLGGAIGAALGGAATVKGIATIGVEFDKQMNTLSAVSQATAPQLQAVEQKARELGRSADLTATSASDAAAAMTELVKGGFDVAQAMDAAKGTLQLASAAQIDAASAATIQSQALQAFGLDASYAATASDVLAGAANASSAEIEGVAQGLQQSGAVANQFGLSIEDNATALAMFANAGIQGSDAGTLLKSALLALTDQGKPAQNAIKELGLTVYDAQGKFVGMEALFGQLSDAQRRMTDEQYQAATATLFGSDAMRLAGVAAREGADGWRETYAAVTRAGQASEVAAAQAQGIPGILEAIQNQAEDTGIAIYDAFSGLAIKGGGELIRFLDSAGPKVEALAGGAARGIEAALPTLERVTGVVATGFGQIADGAGVLATTGVSAVTSFASALAPAGEGALKLSENLGGLTGPLMAAVASLAVGKWQGWGDTLGTGAGKVRDLAVQMSATRGVMASLGQDVSRTGVAFEILGEKSATVKRMGDAYREASGPLREFAAGQRFLAVEAGAAALQSRDLFETVDRMGAQFGRSTIANMASFTGAVKGGFASLVEGAKSAGAGIVSALGGGWNLAIAGAVAGVAVITSSIAKTERSQELLRELQDQAAETGDALYTAMSVGDLTGEIASLNDSLRGLIDTQKELEDTAPGIGGTATSMLRNYWADLMPGGKSGRDVADEWHAQREAAADAKEFSEAIQAAGISAEEAAAAVGGSAAQYDALIGRLDLTTDGGKAAADALNAQRDEYLRMQEIVGSLAPGSVELAEALAKIGDEAASSEDRVSALSKALDNMLGIDPTADEAIAGLHEEIDKVTESAQQAVDATRGFGDTLFGENGKLDLSQSNARDLRESLLGLRESLEEVAVAGEDVGAAYEAQQPALDALAAKYGLTGEQVRDLASQMGLVPELIESTVTVSADEALAGLEEVWGAIQKNQVIAGEPLNLDVANIDETKDKLEDLGYTVEELQRNDDGSGAITITANTQEAIDNVDLLVQSVNALQSEKGITFHSDAPDQIALVQALGIEIESLGNGDYRVTSNTPEQIQLMIDLGMLVKDEKTGKVTITSNLDDVLAKGKELDSRAGKETRERHVVERIERMWKEFAGTSKSTSGTSVGQHYADGAVRTAANGRLSRQEAQIAPGGSWLLWAEDETDGESFIPHALSKRGRATQILAETAGIFGLSLVDENGQPVLRDSSEVGPLDTQQFADGGVRGTGVFTSPTGGGAAADGAVTPVGMDARGVLAGVDAVEETLAPLEQERTVTITADTTGATAGTAAVTAAVAKVPATGQVTLTASTDQATTALGTVATQAGEIDATVAEPTVTADTGTTLDDLDTVRGTLEDISGVTATPEAELTTGQLEESAAAATETLDTLAGQTPTPEADLENSPLLGMVAQSEDELARLGGSKATSVADVNNASALTNIQGVITELNKMPVERVIKIVAHSDLAGFASGGKVGKLATGGRLPTTGPGTDRTDGILGVGDDGQATAWVNAGEWVINRRSSDEYDSVLRAINAGTFPKNLPGYVAGGRVGQVSPEQLLAFAGGAAVLGQQAARSLEGAPYVWGGVNWGDCSGAMSGLARLAVGMDAFGGRFATMSQQAALAEMGFRPGLGPDKASFNVGWFNGGPWGGHTAGTIGGTNVEMGGGRGNGQIGGPAAGARNPQFTDHAHLPLGVLVAFDYFRNIAGVSRSYQAAPAPTMEATGGMGVGTGGMGLGPGGLGVASTSTSGITLTNGATLSWDEAKLYDTGGLWASGTIGVNMSGRNERVLTGAENDLYEGAMRGYPGLIAAMEKVAVKLGGAATELERAALGLETTGDNLTYLVGAGNAGTLIRGVDMSNFGGEWVRHAKVVQEAEADMLKVRREIADENDTLAQRERDLAEAKKELADAENGQYEESLSIQRKLEDKERALADARAEGKPEKIADAERDLARAREDAVVEAGKSEEKRAEAIQKATENVAKKEEALADAQGEAATQAARLEQAERAVIAARFKAIQELATQVGGALESAFSGMSDLFDVLSKQAKIMEETRQRVAAERIERQKADLELQRSRLDAVIAEQDILRVRAAGAIAIADAEAALGAARDAAALKGRTGVDAMSEALDRARVTGKFTVEDIAESVIANSAEVRAAQHAVEEAKAKAAKDELDAVYKQRKAALDMAQATLTQQKAVALLDVSTRQLQAQAARLGGLTAQGVSRAATGWGGAATIGGGLGKLAGGAMGALAGFATGGPLGALIGGGVGLISGLFDIIRGARDVAQNKDEMKQSWDGMSTADKLITGLGLASGAAVGIGGGVASQQYGPEFAGQAALIGAEIAKQSAGYAGHAITSDLERINSLAEEERQRIALEVAKAQAQIDQDRLKTDMEYAMKSVMADANIEIEQLLGKIAQADTTKQADALASAAIVAAERRDEMVRIMSRQLDLAEKSKSAPQVINVQLPENRQVVGPTWEQFETLIDTINRVQQEVELRKTETGVDYLAART
ncbi:phage tail tape measure protein [Corynebacterium sanguinis]|uniref:Phage tail tape measure protein n=1 Tax=Corynebacterium sanguinis TaxID=2594913 RepID=A0A6C1TYY9_9CORY|nr:phage tail tape measure protein [Corynebacterium sanguinis]TVS29795.1 phage tail tape measure protein [Corynebacterium sanguinis]